MYFCRGNVIKIHVKKRIGEKDFIQMIREGLSEHYDSFNQIVGMGGIFILKNGTIKSHIMPGFCDVSIFILFY